MPLQEEAAAIKGVVQMEHVSFLPPSWSPQVALHLPAGSRWGADSAVMGEGAGGLWAPTVWTVEGNGDLVSAW